MKMKKWVILLVCVALLCGAVATSIAIVSAQEDSEPEASASELDSLQAECSESTDAGDGTPSEVDPESTEPLDIPEVVTRSHMVEKVGEDADLVAEALKLYTGQDTKYRVQVDVNWDDRDNRAVHFVFHSLINYDVTKCYECGKNGNFEHTSTDQKKVSEILYRDLTRYLECDTLAIPDLFAELNEESIRILLNCEGVTVTLIDELPERLLPYNEPAVEPNDPPMVVTRSLVQEEPESEIIDMYDKALLQKALDTYAGQNVTFRVVVDASYYGDRDDSAKVDGFYSFHRLIGIDHCTCTMCDAYRQTHQDEAGKPVYGDLHRGEFSGEFYITEEVVCDAIGFEPLWYAELDEASLRALIGCGGPIVALIDEFPEPLWLEFPYKAPSDVETASEQ